MHPQPPAVIDRLFLCITVAAASLLAWFDAATLPRLTPLSLALASTAIWLPRRRRHATGGETTPPSPLLPLVFVASLILVSVINSSHSSDLRITTSSVAASKQNPDNAKTITATADQAFTPRASHIPAFPGTVNPDKTLHRALNLAAVIALGAAIAALTRRHPQLIRPALWLITLNGIVVALLAIHFKSSGSELLLGRYEPINPRFYGPFRYNNFWAAWNLLIAGSTAALLLDALHRRRWLPAAIAALALAPLAVAVVYSQSRSALLVSALFALYLLVELTIPALRRLGIIATRPLNAKKALAATALAALAVAAATLITITSTWHRWATPEVAATKSGRLKDTIEQVSAIRQGHLPDLRLAMSRDTIKMALAKPVWGWGLGSFEYAFPRFAGPEFLEDRYQDQTSNYGKLIRPQYAHNDWTQYWAELGTVGFGALLLSLYRFLRPALPGNTPVSPSTPPSIAPISRPLLAGATLVALFALWDFPLQNFAILALFATTLALAVAAHPRHPAAHPNPA